jgi:hypothetical protein
MRKDVGKSRRSQGHRTISKARLEAMIEEATVDAYGESEQVTGLYTMIEDYLAVPFETAVLGVPVTVEGVDLTERDEIVAICVRGRERQAVSILDLPLPSPAPAGAEWIEAYRHWARDGQGPSR